METSILAYFLKVNLALAILYICYRLLFRNDTFFQLRRFVLLSVYLIAFLYPLPDISPWLSSRESMAGSGELLFNHSCRATGRYDRRNTSYSNNTLVGNRLCRHPADVSGRSSSIVVPLSHGTGQPGPYPLYMQEKTDQRDNDPYTANLGRTLFFLRVDICFAGLPRATGTRRNIDP
ncbi:MAG: hypothetical protein LUD46_16020 [Parabacteroides sp.]|nr:hypothetical protein [Parabacteroides sp.]